MFHRLPERIRAHASICFLALILYSVMRHRLRLAGSDLSPEAALADLRRIRRHRRAEVLAALKIKNCGYVAQGRCGRRSWGGCRPQRIPKHFDEKASTLTIRNKLIPDSPSY